MRDAPSRPPFGASALDGAGVLLLLGLVVLAGCARAGGPPGGVPDEAPPFVVRTVPDTFQLRDRPPPHVEIHFDERISERPASGTMDAAVLVSPQTGSVRVRHRRQSLEISMAGGFRRGVVYQVTLLPVINDMFRNTLQEPYEFFFSTGPDFNPNVLAGLVSDRLTREAVSGARVDARPEGDTIAYSASTDEDGLFSLRFIPPGSYEVVAYEDRNRSRSPDFADPQDTTFVTIGAADTVVVLDLALLPPDTTPSVLSSARVEDSTTVRLTFSDFFDPDVPLDDFSVTLSREDGGAVPDVVRRLHAHELDALLAEERAAAARAARDEEPDPEDVAPPPLPDEEPSPRDAPPLPSRDMGLRLAQPLEPGVTFRVEVAGVVNIAGVPEGGGEADFTRPEPPPDEPPEPPPEGDAVPRDTLPPDTIPPPARPRAST